MKRYSINGGLSAMKMKSGCLPSMIQIIGDSIIRTGPMWIAIYTLIDEVYVSPTSPEWLKEVVQSVLEKYRLPFKPVIKSSLYESPFY